VDESRLTAVKDSSDDPSKIYGSPEDNSNALKSLSEIELSESQSRECIVSTIMTNIANMLDVMLTFLIASCFHCFDRVPCSC
jgi:hypothetical protein